MTLMLVVNREGVPTNIHIATPLGCGLDAKAVQAVGGWRFKPAEKDGQPVAVEVAVKSHSTCTEQILKEKNRRERKGN